MGEKEMIKNELAELLEMYYNGSFIRMVCDCIRISGVSVNEVEELLEVLKKEK